MDINKGEYNNREMNINEPITITKLTEYLVDRYGLSTEGRACLDNKNDDGLCAYRKKIERILKKTIIKKTKHERISLYEYCLEGGVRKISIDMFIKYCFPEWESYLKGLKENYIEDNLAIDRKKYNSLNEPELTDEQRYYEDYYREMNTPEERWYEYSEEVLHEYGTRLMIEGIFTALYGKFDWEKLKFDLEAREEYYDPDNWEKFSDYVDDDDVNEFGELVSYKAKDIYTNYTKKLCEEYEHHICDLSSFENYIKKKNINSSLNDIIEKENNNAEQLKNLARMIKGLK